MIGGRASAPLRKTKILLESEIAKDRQLICFAPQR
jgi:hypothetical protein